MANVQGQKIGQNQGKGNSNTDQLALFLKVFAGEVLTAFARRSVTADKHIVRTIQNGKSAQFPVMGRTSGVYLAPGERLSDKRVGIKHTEKVITIDGLLTADVMIFDIEDAMNHYDVAGEYSNQLGEALASLLMVLYWLRWRFSVTSRRLPMRTSQVWAKRPYWKLVRVQT